MVWFYSMLWPGLFVLSVVWPFCVIQCVLIFLTVSFSGWWCCTRFAAALYWCWPWWAQGKEVCVTCCHTILPFCLPAPVQDCCNLVLHHHPEKLTTKTNLETLHHTKWPYNTQHKQAWSQHTIKIHHIQYTLYSYTLNDIWYYTTIVAILTNVRS